MTMIYMTANTLLTVADAARQVGKSRQTLFDKIKRGQLSATVNHDGNKVIDVSELIRVFGSLLSADQVKKNQANSAGQSSHGALTSTLQLELELAKLRLEHAEKALETSNRQLEEMRVRERQSIEDRTQLLNVIERQTLLLAAPARAKAAPTAKPKTTVKAKVAPAVKKPATARKTPAAKAKPVARSKTVAKPTTRSTAAAVKKVVKKATRK
ncbi:hypothetical protein INP81_24270 (plasmid) [Comamonas thiooxydans]|uniref:hypothetical protein n=1 Tax=Comamonas thiooxydans TaxID=363952 RepID=UPI0018A4871F|nr:hypothetical protein [Comamonas thiooxydans]QOQ84772.1 hypothetical protein INP81_24270 [Comamonas thiooxydans]